MDDTVGYLGCYRVVQLMIKVFSSKSHMLLFLNLENKSRLSLIMSFYFLSQCL